jgi:hypothetical protein
MDRIRIKGGYKSWLLDELLDPRIQGPSLITRSTADGPEEQDNSTPIAEINQEVMQHRWSWLIRAF